MFNGTLSYCILDSAQSFCGCYFGQSGVGWRLEEAQTGKKFISDTEAR